MKYSRRHFLEMSGIGAASLLFSQWGLAKQQIKKPNIIYILADDLGYGDLSCYGQQKFKTPCLDRMAAEGMRFTQHYAGSTVCAPSRCCLMTGKHTGHTFIRANKPAEPEGQYPVLAETVMIPRLLKQAGYRTGAFGKWGLGPPGSTGDPLNQGFDDFFGYICQTKAHNYYPDYLWRNGSKVRLDGNTYSHDLIVDQAFDFIIKNKDQPFFCYLPVTIPHAAMHVPEQYANPFRKKFPQFENKIGVYSGPVVRNPQACFAAMVTHLDQQIGELFQLLKQLNIDDNTLVIFSSDNGPHNAGGNDPEFFNSSGSLRGMKRDLYEGGIRVPMIVRWPKHIQPGSVSELISAFWDVLPTCCDLAGVQPPAEIDGISFFQTFMGRPDKQKKHDYLYWEFPKRGGRQAIRMGNFKAVRLNVSDNPNAPMELYNLETNPAETNNIADQHPDIIAKMSQLFNEARTESEIFPLFQ